jgi:hypothetical protein
MHPRLNNRPFIFKFMFISVEASKLVFKKLHKVSTHKSTSLLVRVAKDPRNGCIIIYLDNPLLIHT